MPYGQAIYSDAALFVNDATPPALDADFGNGVKAALREASARILAAELVTINVQTGTTYTFVLADAQRLTRAGNAAAQTYTIPPNSTVAYPIGVELIALRYGAGALTFVAGAGVVLQNPASAASARARYSIISAIQIAANEWVMTGDLT